RLVVPRATLLEAGSGIGAHAVFLASSVGEGGHLLACEPQTTLRNILQNNLRANGVVNVSVISSDLTSVARVDTGIVAADHYSIDGLCLQHLDWLKIADEMDADRILLGATDTLWAL